MKTTNRERNLPLGPTQYDPSSPDWEEILLEQASKKKQKPGPAKPKQKTALAKPNQKAVKRKLIL